MADKFLNINVYGHREFAQKLKHEAAGLPSALVLGMRKLMEDVRDTSRDKYLTGPRPKRLGVVSGTLRATLRIDAFERGKKIIGVIGTGKEAPYGQYHEEGRRGKWPIPAKKAKALSFIVGGQRKFYKSVEHPGIKARPFLRPAIEDNLDNAKDIFTQILNKIDERVR